MILAVSVAHARQAPGGVPSCPIPPPSSPDPGTFEHRWAGLVHDSFTLDGQEVWTAEDGGRIRHRNPVTGNWSFQHVPFEVQGTIRRIHFLSNGLDGWAVRSDGYILRTDAVTAGWSILARMPGAWGLTEWENLWDVWFDGNGEDGWLLGHHGIWYTTDGGTCWQKAELLLNGSIVSGTDITDFGMKLWAFDIRIDGSHPSLPFLGIAVGQPGWIFRSEDLGRSWTIVLEGYVHGAITLDPNECLYAANGHPQNSPWFQLWDVEISLDPDPEQALILVVGGVDTNTGCGLILASYDQGLTWNREYHECDPPSGTSQPAYCTQPPFVPDTNDPLAPNHHTKFNILYGVAIDSSNNTAIASGYAGQLVQREVQVGGTGIWRDRSEYGSWDLVPDHARVVPLRGVDFGGSPAIAHATGVGGTILRSTDGGTTWQDQTVGEPFRIADVWFKEDLITGKDIGWQIGQFFRLASSGDGGLTWTESLPARQFPKAHTLSSIAFAGDKEHGVTVGTHIPGATQSDPGEGPRILYTPDFGQNQLVGWRLPTSISYASPAEESAHEKSELRRACWAKDAGNLHFWAVGSKGLILRSVDGGGTWNQVVLSTNPASPGTPIADHHSMELHGVAAGSPNGIVIVGSQGAGPDPVAAKAWGWDGTIWTEIQVDLTSPGNIELLTDVAASGSTIHAVGQREHADGSRSGVVLRYVHDPFTPRFDLYPGPLHPDELRACGIALSGEQNRVLNRVALNSNGDLWIAGQCGQVWQRVAATSTWRQHKSQTDADVRGMMFLSPTRGYVGAHGGDHTNHVIVRYQEP